MNDDKKCFYAFVSACCFAAFFCVLVVVLTLLSGCAATSGIEGDAGKSVARNSRDIGRVEATIDALDDAAERSRERISEAVRNSENIEDSIGRVVYLFERYKSIAFGLLDEIDRIRNEIKETCEDNSGGRGDVDDFRGRESHTGVTDN